jgi:hypothetical protein
MKIQMLEKGNDNYLGLDSHLLFFSLKFLSPKGHSCQKENEFFFLQKLEMEKAFTNLSQQNNYRINFFFY